MPAPRLVIIADAKTLPALSSGLREGGRFEVTAVALADAAAAQAAADSADAVAIFYGAAGAPVTGALQALAPRVRQRGGRLVAVLQREQAAQRDECFRAGASDILFMPMPRDQFVTRLQASVGLAWPGEAGAPSPVAVATRTSAAKLDQASVSSAGIEAPSGLPVKPGETVRMSWGGGFQSWGLVVRGSPSAQIRFAGLAPEEETRIREWLKSSGNGVAGKPAVAPKAPPAASAAPAAAPPARPASAPPPKPAAAVVPPAKPPAAPAAPKPPPAAPAAPAARSAPSAGPPPGFADRRPARDTARPSGPPPTPAAQSALADSLFDADAAAPAASAPAPAPAPAVPAGPPWPTPIAAEVPRTAVVRLLAEEDLPADMPANVAASAKKIAGMLSVGERSSIQRAGADSHFVDAVAARVALDAAASEGLRLSAAGRGATVEPGAVAAVTKIADEAAARLQKEANAAIGKGEVESLQMITAASAALSRDLLNFKETADRLRGLGAAPRLGAGALDPDVVLPGQQPRPKPPPGPQAPAPIKPELRDFQAFDRKPGHGKKVFAVIVALGLVAAVANAVYFSAPHPRDLPVESMGKGVERIEVSAEAAIVTVSPDWAAGGSPQTGKLSATLKEKGVKRAVIVLRNGAMVGTLDPATNRLALTKAATSQ